MVPYQIPQTVTDGKVVPTFYPHALLSLIRILNIPQNQLCQHPTQSCLLGALTSAPIPHIVQEIHFENGKHVFLSGY
jgi:hypothetical protein